MPFRNAKVQAAYYSQWRRSHIQLRRTWRRNSRFQKKMAVLLHYSPGIPHCACCGETILQFLVIDHIANNGIVHRREIGSPGGDHFYRWLIKNKFPDGYQVLCYNCNMAKAHFRECPHKTDQSAMIIENIRQRQRKLCNSYDQLTKYCQLDQSLCVFPEFKYCSKKEPHPPKNMNVLRNANRNLPRNANGWGFRPAPIEEVVH